MMARAAMLTTRVIANSTRPEAISALTATPEDSGKSSAMFAAIVDGLPELIRLNVTPPETDRMIVTAIVSPSARPRPSIDAADDRRAAEGQDGHPDHLPARGAEGERALAQRCAASA